LDSTAAANACNVASEGIANLLFRGLERGDGAAVFAHVSDDVDWTVEGE
jgi:ketosteroid isomerase-like protein